MTTSLSTTGAGSVGPGLIARARRPFLVLVQNLAVLLGSLLLASLLIFFALHYLPGDQASILAGIDATPDQVASLRHELGLDRPVLVQYGDWIAGALRGDLGISLLDHRSIADELGQKLQVTIPLCLLAMAVSLIIALPLGMIAGAKSRTWYGSAIGALTQLGVALPVFVAGLVLVLVVSVELRLLPAQGFPADRWADPAGAIRSLILPTLTIAIPLSAVLIRFVRSATMDVLHQDWMRTARAQGWSLPVALIRQGLRNASLPIVAVLGLELSGLLMGSVIVEQVFALPGVGQMLLQDVGNRDITKIQGTLLALTAFIMLLMMGLNVLYSLIDPRLKRAS